MSSRIKMLCSNISMIIIIYLSGSSLSQNAKIPCYNGWSYSQTNGKCYSIIANLASQVAAASYCSQSLSSLTPPIKSISPNLVRIKTMNDALSLMNVMSTSNNNAPLWMDISPSSTPGSLTYGDGSMVDMGLLQSLSPSSIIGNNPCLTFKYYYLSVSGSYQTQYNISNINCLANVSYSCEHDSKTCDLVTLPFQPSTMQLIPNSLFVLSYVYVSCQIGYFRPSELQPPIVYLPGIIPNNYAYCTGSPDASGDPAKYNNSWYISTIEQCQQVSCPQFSGTLNNVVNQISPALLNAYTSYNFSNSFSVSCMRGYISYINGSTTMSSITCQPSPTDKSQGIWAPTNLSPCVAIKCDMSILNSMIPVNAIIQSARNKISQQQYDVVFQMSFLPLFNNIISIQCNDGYFFPDRTWSKQVICDLRNNSMTIGDWQGYLGTTLPMYPSCQNSTCTFEAITITPALNLKSYFLLLNSIGVYVNQTQVTGNPYPYQSQLLFYCNDGYNTAGGMMQQNLLCGPQGSWIPNLTPCIMVIPALNIGNAQHYTPPAVEASSAKQIGVVAIVILVVFLSLIIILDMSTIVRDVKLMTTNIKNLKAAIKERQRKNQ